MLTDPDRIGERDEALRLYHRSGSMLKSTLIVLGMCVIGTLAVGLMLRGMTPSTPKAAMRPVPAAPPARSEARPAPNALVYRADGSGHFLVDASVNGAPVRFLVDTGATAVTLSPEDARAAGLVRAELDFSETVTTAHGMARAAATTLRDVRLQQLELDDVPALVMEQPMPVSLLGMSFLKRLNGYSIRDGVLTMEW